VLVAHAVERYARKLLKAKRATGGCSAIETAAERLGELRMSAAHAETRDAAPRLQH
jgi:hypothetical protein